MKITREQFQNWCKYAVDEADREQEPRALLRAALAEHDPELARLEQEGYEAWSRTIAYLRKRMGRVEN